MVAAGRTQAKLDAVVEEIRAAGGEASAFVGDATVQVDTRALFDATETIGGPPKIAVYNAGNNQFSSLLEMDEAFFTDLWKICALGGFFFGQESARRMIPAGGGTLVFTGATASIRARPPFTAFASAKAAERAIAHGMAREFGAQGLHVGHVIIDGVIDGEQVNDRFPQIRESKGADGMLQVDAIADAFWTLHVQHRSAWTLELDLRPFKESF